MYYRRNYGGTYHYHIEDIIGQVFVSIEIDNFSFDALTINSLILIFKVFINNSELEAFKTGQYFLLLCEILLSFRKPGVYS